MKFTFATVITRENNEIPVEVEVEAVVNRDEVYVNRVRPVVASHMGDVAASEQILFTTDENRQLLDEVDQRFRKLHA